MIPQEKGFDFASEQLEELRRLPNRVPAIFVAIRFDFLLSSLSLCLRFVTLTQFPSTTDFHCFVCRGGLAGTRCNMEADGGRKLVRTSTSWAERQRMIEAEASRIAMLNAALPRAGIPIPEAKGLFKPETANLNAFLLDGHTARFLSRERKWGVWSCRPQAASPSRIGAAKLPLPARYGTLFHSKVSPTDPLHST